MKGAGRTKKMIKDDGKKQGKGKKIERKKTLVTTAEAKEHRHQDEPPHRPSKYVGVSWRKREEVASLHQDQWQAEGPGPLPRRERGRAHVRRASRAPRQTRELSAARGYGTGGEEGAEGKWKEQQGIIEDGQRR